MAKEQGVIQAQLRRRTPLRTGQGGSGGPPGASEAPKKPFNPIQFLGEVRAEARKITWTSWKETWITSVMVGIMVAFTAVFFMLVDGGLSAAVQWLLSLRLG
jgi:preprotein translocase subunit SecE